MPKTAHGTWSPEDLARLRSLAVQGLENAQIAAALGRSVSSVAARMSRHGWHDRNLQFTFKERIIELAGQGWTASRIARRTGVDAVLVERVLYRAGVEARQLPARPNAGLRYGVDMPYPAPRQEVSQ